MNPKVTNTDYDLHDVVTKKQLVAESKGILTEGQLDWILRNRARNGLSQCGAVIRQGRGGELKLIRPRFTKWYLSQLA